MKYKRLIASILSALMIVPTAVTPVVSAQGENIPVVMAEEVQIPELIANGTGYVEDFEDGTAQENATNQKNGYSYDGLPDGTDNHRNYANIWVGNLGSGSNSFRFASETWFKTMWLNLDLKENGIAKYVAAGYEEADAQEKVEKYLSEDMQLSLRFKSVLGGNDANSTHEEYIRIKGDRANRVSELKVKYANGVAKLYIVSMNSDMSKDEEYLIGEIDVSEANSEWHNVVIVINHESNVYTMNIDGMPITSTPWGRYIPMGTASDEDKTVDSVGSLELGHSWSGWWQSLIIDDLKIEPAVISDEPIEDGITEGIYQISGFENGAVLDDENGGLTLSEITQGAENQKWYIDDVSDKTFRIINSQSGMAVSVSEDDDRSLIQEKVDETSKRQLWEKIPYSLDTGEIHIMNHEIPRLIQVDGGQVNNGATAALWDYESSIHTRWTLKDAGNGFVYLQNGVGTYLQVDQNNSTEAGAKINLWEFLAGNDKLWKISSEGEDLYSISNPTTGEKLVSDDGNIAIASAESANGVWTAESKSIFGKGSYYVFKNTADETELSVSDENKWIVTAKNIAQSLPAVQNVKISGNMKYGEELSVSYDYSSSDNTAEGDSSYNVYVLNSEFDKAENPIESGSAKGGFKFALTEEYTKDKVLAVEIIPQTVNGDEGASVFKYIKPQNGETSAMNVTLTGEKTFSSADLTAIRKGNGAYTSEGKNDSDYIVQISTKDGMANSLGIVPTAWWKTGKLLLDLDKDGVGSVEGNGYLEMDVMFDAPHYFDADCRMIVALNNGTTDFASVRLIGRRMDIVAMNSDGTYRKLYTKTIGADKCFRKWMNFKFYTDGVDKFALAIDDEFVRNDDGGIWLKAAKYACDGPYTVESAAADKIAAVKMGFEWAGMDSALRVANLKVGTYTMPQVNSWSIISAEPQNGELKFGKTNKIDVKVKENETAQGELLLGLYKDDRLISAKKITDIGFDARGVFETTTEFFVPEAEGDYEIRVFAWDEKQRPLCGKYANKQYVEAAFNVANVFSDNMMLQADKPITVWGSAFEEREVEATLTNTETGKTHTAKTVSDGTFSIELPAQEAGGNYTLTVTSGTEEKTYSNIIFGDVYLLAGQSNMEYRICDFTDASTNIKTDTRVDNPNIRLVNMVQIATNGASQPQEKLPEVTGTMWKPMNSENAWTTSAIGYYFAQQLNADTGRPIGLLAFAVGGTGSDTWVENGTLYNNRVYPVRNLELSGILYYQGCADVGKTAEAYSDIMAGIVDDYRKLFNDDDLPFYYAQLARFTNTNHEEIRAGQTWAFDKVANKHNVGYVSTLDEVGNKGFGDSKRGNARNDIHPNGKEEIAGRFALWAKRDIYGEKLDVMGPMYKSMSIVDNTVELEFECTGSLQIMDKDKYGDYKTEELISAGKLNPEKLGCFEIAGSDGRYYEAEAEIFDGNKVRVTSSNVAEPVKVRYAWGAYPEIPNLTDDTGLPSYTFATDCTNR